jgi:hypothetical protein
MILWNDLPYRNIFSFYSADLTLKELQFSNSPSKHFSWSDDSEESISCVEREFFFVYKFNHQTPPFSNLFSTLFEIKSFQYGITTKGDLEIYTL